MICEKGYHNTNTAEIAKSAKTCPKCGAKQKKSKVLGIVLVVLGLIIFFAAIGSSGSDDEPKKVGNTGTTQNTKKDTTKKDDTKKEPEKTTFGVGEQVILNDIVVTMNGVTESSGSDFNKPSEGNTFILCEFTIENNSDKELNISSLLCFNGYIDDFSTSFSLSAQMESDKGQLDGAVAPGKKMNGIIAYEAASDWKEIEIHFTPDVWSGKDIKFVASK